MMLRPTSVSRTLPIPVAELVVEVADQQRTPEQTPVVYSIDDDELPVIASLAKIRAQASPPFRKNKTLLSSSTPTSSQKQEMHLSHGQGHDSPRKLDTSIHGSSASTSNSSSRSSEIIDEMDELVQGSYGCFEDIDLDPEIVVPPDLSLQSIDEADAIPVGGGINDEFIFDLEL